MLQHPGLALTSKQRAMGLFSSSAYDEFTKATGTERRGMFKFAKCIDEATSEYIPAAQEDLALNLEITDMIKSKRVAAKDAMRYLKQRLLHPNPNVQLLTLQLVDKCVKNGGKHFLVELAGREFVDDLVGMMHSHGDGRSVSDGAGVDDSFGVTIQGNASVNEVVRLKLIEHFQTWSLLLQADPDLAYLTDTYNNLHRNSLIRFPSPAASIDHLDPTAIVNTLAPPEWTDANDCQRCRTAFSFSNRKHHCRKCGGTFCQLCSEKSMPILGMGITEAVRVCDSCYSSNAASINLPISHKFKPLESTEDLAFKRAIELSLAEQKQPTSPAPTPEEEKQLKAAIEASLNDAHPVNSSSTISQRPDSPTASLFTAIELDNIKLFSSLITRLLLTRPQIPADDAKDLKSLAGEMRSLQRRLESFQRAHGSNASARLVECGNWLKSGLDGFEQLNLDIVKQPASLESSSTAPEPVPYRTASVSAQEPNSLPASTQYSPNHLHQYPSAPPINPPSVMEPLTFSPPDVRTRAAIGFKEEPTSTAAEPAHVCCHHAHASSQIQQSRLHPDQSANLAGMMPAAFVLLRNGATSMNVIPLLVPATASSSSTLATESSKKAKSHRKKKSKKHSKAEPDAAKDGKAEEVEPGSSREPLNLIDL